MADDQTQQTRVLLLNGQTIILQGDAGDNAINEINADLLQQALQEATGTAGTVEEPTEEEYGAAPNTENNENNLVAIFKGDQGETHTVQLTVEQAQALGLHFMADEEKNENTDNLTVANPQITVPSEENQLVYSGNTITSSEEKLLFDQCVNTQTSINNLSQSTTLQDDSNSALQQTIAGIGVLPGVTNYIGDSNNITLVSQVVNGQMTYTVKLNEDQNQLQNQEFSVMEGEGEEEDVNEEKKSKLPLITSVPASPVSSVSSSASPVVATSLSSIHLNSMSPTVTALQPNATLPKCTPGTSLLARTTGSPVQKTTSYVFVPTTGPSSTASTPVGKQGTTHLLRTANRTQMPPPPPLQPARQNTSTNSASATALTGIPLMNSNINITRTSSSSSGLLQSTSLTGGGMIRVVAGGTATRIVPTTSSNGPKFTNILTPSGRLVAASSVGTTAQRIIAVNTTANSTKTVAVTSSSAPVTVPATTTAVSASSATSADSAGTAVQSNPARLNSNPSSKPLGSSENPIQLVQHGQTFHSVQALSQEQLRQIATVLQQQHLDSAPRTKNVLYDAETNTRIIYRVVYPEDLDLHEPPSPTERSLSSSGIPRGRGRRGRPPKSAARPLGRGTTLDSPSSSMARKPSLDIDLDEDRLADDPSKGERKKQVARTRSGRLSRPPRHMVKDYKRLHHLDFADADLDDSDGGYSDYQMSDREVEEADSLTALEPFATTTITPITAVTTTINATTGAPTHSTTTTTAVTPAVTGTVPQQLPEASTGLLPGLQVTKRKISSHFRCPTCQKVYLGHSRMARHFEMYPDHGSIEQLNVPDKVGPHSTMNGMVRTGAGRRRGKRRGPWAYMTPEARSERRKIKLREVLVTCEAPELVEVAGPSVASVASMWELLQLRIEAIRDESLIATLCEELRALLEKVQSVVGDVLCPATSSTNKEDLLDLQDEMLCNALGLPCGRYQVVEDQLLSRRSQMGYDTSLEPPNKRLKSEENLLDDVEKPIKMEDERKPLCPEVLSALALDPKPTSVVISPAAGSALTSVTAAPSTELEEDTAITGSSLHSTEDDVKEIKSPVEDKTETEPEVDPQFLLPSTTEMCVDGLGPESEGQGQDLQTVDDIVNERLKNLTGFAVNGPEPEPTPPTGVSHATDTEVPTFDPEMALAAMGEGDQNISGTSLSEFAPEIALAAMGEGSEESTAHPSFAASSLITTGRSPSLGNDHPQTGNNAESQQEVVNPNDAAEEIFSSDLSVDVRVSQSTNQAKDTAFTTSIITNSSENSFITSLASREQDVGKCNTNEPVQSVESFDPEIALAAMGEGDGPQSSTFDTEMALASMGEGSAPGPPQFQPPASAAANDPEFQLTGMDVSLDGSGPELDFETLSAEFTQTTRHS